MRVELCGLRRAREDGTAAEAFEDHRGERVDVRRRLGRRSGLLGGGAEPVFGDGNAGQLDDRQSRNTAVDQRTDQVVAGMLAAMWVLEIIDLLPGVDLTGMMENWWVGPALLHTVLFTLISLALSFVATLYPSWRASRVNPAEALRYE